MRTSVHRGALIVAVLTAMGSLLHCGDDDDRAGDADAGVTPPALLDAAPPPPPLDARAPDGGRLASCVERPTDLPRPPTGRLPCELIPPGLQL
jgi:hypothetical protein